MEDGKRLWERGSERERGGEREGDREREGGRYIWINVVEIATNRGGQPHPDLEATLSPRHKAVVHLDVLRQETLISAIQVTSVEISPALYHLSVFCVKACFVVMEMDLIGT